jgi:transcriptional regulator GlxA family with amidase domain
MSSPTPFEDNLPCRRQGSRESPQRVIRVRRLPRRELVARVTAILGNNLGEPITVAELSRLVGVSERTLRAAFHDVIGISPKRYAIAQRLRAAREALFKGNPDTTTVTDVAMTFGFFELGRFAGRYRHAFGEAPSQTLRQIATEVSVSGA